MSKCKGGVVLVRLFVKIYDFEGSEVGQEQL
jgi:hypothetical protein